MRQSLEVCTRIEDLPTRSEWGSCFLYVAKFETKAKVGVTVRPQERMKEHSRRAGGAAGERMTAVYAIELPERVAHWGEGFLSELLHQTHYRRVSEWFHPALFSVVVALAADLERAEAMSGLFADAASVGRWLPLDARYAKAA